MDDIRTASANWLLRSSQEIFSSLNLRSEPLEDDVLSSINLVERASALIQKLIGRMNELERTLSAARGELTYVRAEKDEMAQRLAIADEAIKAQSERARQAEQLLESAREKANWLEDAHERANRLEQANTNLSAQLQRVVSSVNKSLTMPRRDGSTRLDIAA